MRALLAPSLALILLAATHPALAADGDDQPKHTRTSQNVPELKLGKEGDQFWVSQTDFKLISPQGYRWEISSAGGLGYKFKTDLFRNVWMNQIVIDDVEVHMDGAPAWLEFDEEGSVRVDFATVRPGIYTWYIEGLEGRGMKGTITIK